jgi:D-sedoheptulose 7-phosphate isomerase
MKPISELLDVLSKSQQLEPLIDATGRVIVDCLKRGGKLFSCGNGGSAADAMHLAQELVGRYKVNRRALPAICLNSDVTALTCIGNDYGYDQVFSRQLSAFARPGDVLVGFSTSGNSPNVLATFAVAKALKVTTILLTGRDGGQARGMCDYELIIPSQNTARIQEVHTLVLHSWLDVVEPEFSPAAPANQVNQVQQAEMALT